MLTRYNRRDELIVSGVMSEEDDEPRAASSNSSALSESEASSDENIKPERPLNNRRFFKNLEVFSEVQDNNYENSNGCIAYPRKIPFIKKLKSRKSVSQSYGVHAAEVEFGIVHGERKGTEKMEERNLIKELGKKNSNFLAGENLVSFGGENLTNLKVVGTNLNDSPFLHPADLEMGDSSCSSPNSTDLSVEVLSIHNQKPNGLFVLDQTTSECETNSAAEDECSKSKPVPEPPFRHLFKPMEMDSKRLAVENCELKFNALQDSGLGSSSDSVLTRSDYNCSTADTVRIASNAISAQSPPAERKNNSDQNNTSEETEILGAFDNGELQSVGPSGRQTRLNERTKPKILSRKATDSRNNNNGNSSSERKINPSYGDLESFEGKSLKDFSSNWILNRRPKHSKVPGLRNKKRALTKVKESLGSLLATGSSKQSKHEQILAKQISPPTKKSSHENSNVVQKWFHRTKDSDRDDSTIERFSPSRYSVKNKAEHSDPFLRARYSGFGRENVVTGSSSSFSDSDSKSGKVNAGRNSNLIKFKECNTSGGPKDEISKQCDRTDSQQPLPNPPFNYSFEAVPKKGILKKGGSVDSSENFNIEDTAKRKRNVVTYALPPSCGSGSDDYDSIEELINQPNEERRQPASGPPYFERYSHDGSELFADAQPFSDELQRLEALTYERIANRGFNTMDSDELFFNNYRNGISILETLDIRKNLAENSEIKSFIPDISSLGSKGSIGSTKASFDCIKPNRYEHMIKLNSGESSTGKFCPQLTSFNLDLPLSFSEHSHLPKNRFKSNIPVPTRLLHSRPSLSLNTDCNSDCVDAICLPKNSRNNITESINNCHSNAGVKENQTFGYVHDPKTCTPSYGFRRKNGGVE